MIDSPWRRRAGSRPLVIGHRGANRQAPENTLEAFELAVQQGADGVELDVRLTADDHMVIVHDRTLERLTNGQDSRAIEDVAFAELSRLDLRKSSVPELGAVVSWAAGNDVLVNVELKHDVRNQTALITRVLEAFDTAPRVVPRLLLSCFDARVVWALVRRVPSVPVAWILHDRPFGPRRLHGWKRLGAVAVHPEHRLCTEHRMSVWNQEGAWVGPWVVNAPTEAVALAAQGVNAVFTDEPAIVLRALSSSR